VAPQLIKHDPNMDAASRPKRRLSLAPKNISLTIAAFVLSLATTAGTAAAPEPLILGVHPYLLPAEIVTRFAPLAGYLDRQLGRRVQVRVGRDYGQHIEAIGRNTIDIAYVGPASYVKMVARHGAKPLLARIEINGKPSVTAYIVTRADSPLRKLAELRGKHFAFGDVNSTMGAIGAQHVLRQAGVGLENLAGYQYLGSHRNVALAVLSGDYEAGAVRKEIYDELQPRGLRVLVKMPEVSEHLFVTRSDLPAGEITRLRQALLGLKNAPGGGAILQAIDREMTAMVPVSDADYNSLREIQRALEDKRG
jgi:phosphonate transport system substrate-binding protein